MPCFPAPGSVDNTRAALHFANAAKKVTVRPKVNEVSDEKALIQRMGAEILALKKQLAGREVSHQGCAMQVCSKQNPDFACNRFRLRCSGPPTGVRALVCKSVISVCLNILHVGM